MSLNKIEELIEQKQYNQAEELVNKLSEEEKLRGNIFRAKILFFRSSPLPALKLIDKTLEEAKEQGDKVIEFGSLVVKSFILYNENRFYDILEHFSMGEQLLSQMDDNERKEVQEWEANLLNIKGSYFYQKLDYESAIEAFKRNYEIHSKLGNQFSMAQNLDNIALCYFEKGEYEISLEFKLKMVPILEKFDTQENIAILLNGIGLNYIELGDLDTARGYYEKSLRIFERLDDNKSMLLILNKLVKLNGMRGKENLVLQYKEYIDKLKN